mgnify:FL=1
MLFLKKQYPIFEIGIIASFERDLRTLYGRVIGLNSYEVAHGKLPKRERKQYLQGKYVVLIDSDGKLLTHSPHNLRRIDDLDKVIEALKTIRHKERERGVPVDSQIHFLEHLVKIPGH